MATADGLGWIRDQYDVPAAVGMRVTHDGDAGTITGSDDARVTVRFDGQDFDQQAHPLSLDYLDGVDPAARLHERNSHIAAVNASLKGASE